MHKEFLFLTTIKEGDFFPVEKNKKRLLKSQILAPHLCVGMKSSALAVFASVGSGGVWRLLLAKVVLHFFLFISSYIKYFQSWLCPKEKITNNFTGAWICLKELPFKAENDATAAQTKLYL